MKIEHPADIFEEVYQKLLEKYNKPIDLSMDFLPALNKKIWGLKKQNCVVVGGRSSMGKSVLLLQMAHSFARQGKKVMFFTLEMSIETCFLRMMNDFCSIDNWGNVAGISPQQHNDYAPRLLEFKKSLKNLGIVFIESYGKTFEEIFRIMEEMNKDIDAVFIDHVQMVKVGNRQTDKQAIDEYIKQLRNYAITRNFCAIIGSQINRGTYDKKKVGKPEIWELKSSGALEEVADIVFLVHWQWYYTHEKEEFNEFWIRVAKNREGRTGIFNCKFEPQYFRLSEDENGKDKRDRTPNMPNDRKGWGLHQCD